MPNNGQKAVHIRLHKKSLLAPTVSDIETKNRALWYNANGLRDKRKWRMLVESCLKVRVNILRLSDIHLSGQDTSECRRGKIIIYMAHFCHW